MTSSSSLQMLPPHAPLSHQDEAAAAVLLSSIRKALQLREIDGARQQFLRLPQLDTLHEKWLEDVLRDAYTAGLFDINAVLSFLESLPNWNWTLDGCCVLHRVNSSLESSAVHIVHVPTLPVAYFLHKLVHHLDGSVKVRAESYWYEWVSPTMRAIVTGQPIMISSHMRREVLYAPASNFAFDFDRRNVFTWRQAWTPDERKNHWRLIPASVNRDRFYLQSIQFEEYMYAADYAKYKRDDRGLLRSRVFGWRKKNENVGESGHWQLVPIDANDRNVFAIYNPYQKEYLYSPSDVYDGDRRYVLTAAPNNKDPSWLEERKWRITPVQFTPMEQGIEAFFMKRYAEAVDRLTAALDETTDHPDHIKCYVYRMTANLRMGKSELIQDDFDRVEAVGGDKAAIFHGLHHLWAENAALFQLQANCTGTDLEASSQLQGTVAIDHHLRRGDQLFVMKDYEVALGAYQEAASTQLETDDRALKAKQAGAKLSCAKCFFALQQPENALVVLEEMLASTDLSGEMEAWVLLWMGRCKRQQKEYDDAMALLERALDRLASTDAGHQWMRQCLLTEMQVIGIYRKGLLDELLAQDKSTQAMPPSREASKTVQQMVDLFHCPLSLELMQDPVMTPNGDTFERDMIERHLDVNGQFDPMTRAPLTKAQLYPNRALKLLMETLLSEHKLGLLLASCSSE